MPINKAESYAAQKKAQRAAISNQRKQMREKFTREGFNKGLTPFKGIRREENEKLDVRTLAQELASIARNKHNREIEVKQYFLKPSNVINRLFEHSNAGKQIREIEKEQLIARHKLLVGLKKIVPETAAFYAREWRIII